MTKTASSAQGSAYTVADYMRQPYMRSVIPQPDGSYHAEIVELPGCIATGANPAEAYQQLEAVAESWLEAAIVSGQPIPPAMDQADFSGKMVVRMPRTLHRKASFTAQRENVSLNQFIVSCVAEGVGAATRGFVEPVKNIFNFPQVNVLKEEVGKTAGLLLLSSTQGSNYARNYQLHL